MPAGRLLEGFAVASLVLGPIACGLTLYIYLEVLNLRRQRRQL